jgi:hypothetical protein
MKTSRYSFYRPMSAHESMSAWRAKLKNMREKFEANQAEASSALSSAATDHITASGDIVARIAAARIQAEALAKAEAQKKLPVSEHINTSKADVKDSMFSGNTSGTLDSGTKVDLGKDTITLTNGKTIDIRTGVQVWDFTA